MTKSDEPIAILRLGHNDMGILFSSGKSLTCFVCGCNLVREQDHTYKCVLCHHVLEVPVLCIPREVVLHTGDAWYAYEGWETLKLNEDFETVEGYLITRGPDYQVPWMWRQRPGTDSLFDRCV